MRIILSYIIIFILLTGISSCTLVKHSPIKSYVKAQNEPYDAVIIPGFPHDGKEWNKVIKFRLLWAVHLYENKLAKNFIFSGGAVHSEYNEAIVMALYAIKMGIPKEHVFIETQAKHSSENVFYSLKIAEELGFKNIAVATDPIQGFLLSNYTERIRDKKINYLYMRPHKIRPRKHCPEPKIDYCKAYDPDFIPLKEKKSFWERKKESLGLEIDYGMKPGQYLKYSKWFDW